MSTRSQNNSGGAALLSLGLCARLSLLNLSDEELARQIRDMQGGLQIEDLYSGRNPRREAAKAVGSDSLDSIVREQILAPIEDQILTLVSVLTKELVALLEAIVLGERLLFLRGHSQEVRDGLQLFKSWAKEEFDGWRHYIADWSQAAELANFLLDDAKAEPAYLSDPRVAEVELLINSMDGDVLVEILSQFGSNGIDLEMFNALIVENEWLGDIPRLENESNDEYWKRRSDVEREAASEFMGKADEFLGDDWRAYRTSIDNEAGLPSGLLRGSFREVLGSHGLRKYSFDLALYSELQAMLELGGISVSNLASGQYFSRFVAQEQCKHFELQRIFSRRVSLLLEAHLEEVGLTCLSLRLPPIARICLHNADSVLDAVRNAVKLRSDPLAVELRSYLSQVAQEDRPFALLKHLKRFYSAIESKLDRLGPLIDSGVGFSSTGSISLSLSGLSQRLLEWRNPAILVNTRWIDSLGAVDSVTDLSRVLARPRPIVDQAIRGAFTRVKE